MMKYMKNVTEKKEETKVNEVNTATINEGHVNLYNGDGFKVKEDFINSVMKLDD